jgi:hypothetical protein
VVSKQLARVAPLQLQERAFHRAQGLDAGLAGHGRPFPTEQNYPILICDRKVKCDEQRPVCGQCDRLGHNCDYNPRLSFRDDTPRVVERMQDVTTIEQSIWDSQYYSPTRPTRAPNPR